VSISYRRLLQTGRLRCVAGHSLARGPDQRGTCLAVVRGRFSMLIMTA
jgi:hypothetical protein